MEFVDKKVLVCGMARSGIAAAFLLKKHGAKVILQDFKRKEELENTEELEKEGITLYTGKNPDEIVTYQDLIILSPGIPCDLPFILTAKQAGIPVWSEVELAFHFTPCAVAAITGTNGKTTTTAMLGEILKTQYPDTAVVGNIGVPYSEKVEDLHTQDYVVLEISSFQLETVHTFHPKISAVLNITPDHLNRHRTMENYIATKERIFENQTNSDYCILNYEDEICRAMADKTDAHVFYFSSSKVLKSGIFLENGNIILKWNGKNETVLAVQELRILGIHNYENAMAAIAMSVCAGISLEKIRTALRGFAGVEHRIEYVTTVNDVDYYNDSKGTNPDASIKAVLAMTKPIILIGGGYDKQSDFTQWVKTFKGRVKELILLGVTAPQIKAAANKEGFYEITIADSFEHAVESARSLADSGDCVLLSPACASWDMFESYEQRGDTFKQLVKHFME